MSALGYAFTDIDTSVGEFGHFTTKCKSKVCERLGDYGGSGAELRTSLEKDLEPAFHGSISNSSLANSTTSEEVAGLDSPFHILLSPGHHDVHNHLKSVMHVGDVYSLLFDFPPRKLIPIGSDFQAELPEWDVHGNEQKSVSSVDRFVTLDQPTQFSKLEVGDGSSDESRLSGTCIIPMPELDRSEDNVERIGAGRISCSCEDEGPLQCVKQHIAEAREKLRVNLGQENFAKLGFYDMGDIVSEKWSEEEELIFHEVVSSNPATLGKNFWDYLSIEFPSKTKKEIVSYYFNVFMLRKRAMQNRSVPLIIDSDDDEWEGTDDSAHFDIHEAKEFDDSAVESPINDDDFGHDELQEDEHKLSEDCFAKLPVNDVYDYLGGNNVPEPEAFHNQGSSPTVVSSDQVVSNGEFYKDEVGEEGAPETSGHAAHVNFCENKVSGNVDKNSPLEAFVNHSTIPIFQPSNQLLSNEQGGPSVQHRKRTCGDAWSVPKEVSSEKANDRKHWRGSRGIDQEFLLGPCSSKEWEAGYHNCPGNEDFLPTCSMIEEIFGNEACNYKTTDI